MLRLEDAHSRLGFKKESSPFLNAAWAPMTFLAETVEVVVVVVVVTAKCPWPPRGIHSLAFSPSGRLLALGCGDGYLQLVPFPSLTSVSGRRGATERLSALCFTGDRHHMGSCWGGAVKNGSNNADTFSVIFFSKPENSLRPNLRKTKCPKARKCSASQSLIVFSLSYGILCYPIT